MATKLSSIETREVSLVDRAANKKRFALRKNEDGMLHEDVVKACLELPLENEAEIDAKLEAAGVEKKAADAMKGIARLLHAFRDQISDAHLNLLKASDNKDEEDEEPTEEADKAGAEDGEAGPADEEGEGAEEDEENEEDEEDEEEKTMTEKADKLAGLTPEARAEIEALFKSHSERLAKAEADAAAAKQELAKQMDANRSRECVEKANREFSLLGAPTKVGAVLKALQDKGIYAEVEPLLKAAQAKAQAAGLFRELGSSEALRDDEDISNPASIEARLQKRAQELAAAKGITVEKAYREVLTQNQDAYASFDRAHMARQKGV